MTDSNDAVIWMRPEKPARGKTPAHSRADIAGVAIRIADAEGLDAVSMRRVAKEIGAGTMTLYRYVRTKDELYALMVDALMAGVDEVEQPSGDLDAELRWLANSARRTVLDHPWYPVASAGVRAPGPNMLRGMESAMAALDRPGLEIDELFQIINTVMTFAQGYAQSELAELAAGIKPGPVESSWEDDGEKEYMLALMKAGEHPYLSRLIVEAFTPHSSTDEQFNGMLNWLIGGIVTGVRERTALHESR